MTWLDRRFDAFDFWLEKKWQRRAEWRRNRLAEIDAELRVVPHPVVQNVLLWERRGLMKGLADQAARGEGMPRTVREQKQ